MFPDQIDVPLQPRQIELNALVENSLATWIGFGGSRGGAKSHGARAVMLRRRLQYRGTWGVIIRSTFNDLWEEHITKYFRDWPFLRECYNTQHHEISLPNGGGIKFGYAQHAGSFEKQFQGKGYMDVMVDEATQHTERDITFLRTCCRWPGVPKNACKMLLTMNPGGRAHSFVKRVFITGKKDRSVYRDKENPDDYAFLQSRAWDNVEWVRDQLATEGLTPGYYYDMPEAWRFNYFIEKSDYGQKLNALPPALRVGHLLGDWDSYAGQFFDIFTPQRHVRHMSAELRPWYPRWISIDWGYAHNCAIYGHVALPDESVHTYKEVVVYNKTPAQLGEIIASEFAHDGVQQIFLSPDGNQRKMGPDTIAIQLSNALEREGLPRTSLANAQRVAGWTLWYQLMQADSKIDRNRAMWTCDPSCGVLIETIPNASRGSVEDGKAEDVVKVNVDGASGAYGDDSWESVRMGLLSRLGPVQPPLEERVLSRVSHLDYTSRQHAIPRITREEQCATDLTPWSMKRPNRRLI